jgi:hypothetical protein
MRRLLNLLITLKDCYSAVSFTDVPRHSYPLALINMFGLVFISPIEQLLIHDQFEPILCSGF